MSCLTIAWSMVAAACLTLAAVYFFIWTRVRQRRAYLFFSLTATGSAANAFFEMSLLQTTSVDAYHVWIRWQVLAVAIIISGLVCSVRSYFGTGRRWLARTILALWGGVLILNFASPHNGVFVEITALRQIPTFCGEAFTVAEGVRQPLTWIADVASLLFVIYVVDASVALWRRGGRRRAVVVGGSITLFILAAGVQAPLVDLGILKMPYLISFAFMAIVVAMGYELGLEAVEAGRLSLQLKADERRWRSLLENIELAVVGIDTRGQVNYMNPFLSRLVGHEPESMIGRPLETLLPEREWEHFRARLTDAIATGPRAHSQWPFLCSNGEERMITWSAVRLFDSGGTPAGILAVGADITERLQAESELQKTELELAQAMRGNLAGELASALAHELNQPLTAILSNAQAGRRFLAAGNPDLEELRAMFDDIARDDKRAGEVIHRLRAMLRKEPVIREPCDLSEIVQEVVLFLNSELINHHASVRMELEDGLPQVAVGRVEIQQVLINLMMNSLQAMADTPSPERIVTIQTRRRDGNITVAVRDRGPGLAADRLQGVFEPFVSSKVSGMGMGLAICRRLTEAHGGWIDAGNHPDGGAEFSFTLPVSPGKAALKK